MSTQSITCPKCGEVFALTDAAYVDIVAQVKNATFEKELHERVATAQKLAEKDAELAKQHAAQASATEITKLKAELEAAKAATKSAVEAAEAKAKAEVVELKAKIDAAETQKELAVTVAVSSTKEQLGKEIQALKDQVVTVTNNHKNDTDALNGQIESLKNFRNSQGSQAIGDEFEKWCEHEYDKLRAGAFRNASFDRDTTVKDGTKGDYIFRELSTQGAEVVSIMFEMKNKSDASLATKKNTDFLDKLHKDRVKKGCEYAILVTTLEPDNDLYNSGIVDVSHIHDKMFIIRPAFFIPLTILLRNVGLAAIESKNQLMELKAQSLDIVAFEKELGTFTTGFSENIRLFGSHYEKAILRIQASIDELEDVKVWLEKAKTQFGHANNKVNKLSITSLTKNSPGLRAIADEARANAPIEGEVVDHDDE